MSPTSSAVFCNLFQAGDGVADGRLATFPVFGLVSQHLFCSFSALLRMCSATVTAPQAANITPTATPQRKL